MEGFEVPLNEIDYNLHYIELVSNLPDQKFKKTPVFKGNKKIEMFKNQYQWEVLDTDQVENKIYAKALLNHNSINLDKMLFDEKILEDNDLKARNEVKNVLLGVWKKILHSNDIDLESNFFDIGGNSLLAVKMEVELEEKGWYIENLNMIENPTINNIAKYMKKEEENG
ncbi:acyl carrier protein [Staphylococcus intermedius]|uniref:Putative non-ribosomal peptide synthetase n=1 Tax=Staphylococcus intermedius NCTC 11048 TaxID=1141106 RepID=A0A380G035_STAIN|nr:acyl carrier protein [Staphylococcus intermedius]PNZ49516.1 acyl carrier protein [Staphylococcus intermedius NCTC 11048]SUM43740.1 putative non-ribosomal peptide synthetase [Staphylococcus intermedius NCTC 11048]